MTFRVNISEYNKLSNTVITKVQIVEGTNLGFSRIDHALTEVNDKISTVDGLITETQALVTEVNTSIEEVKTLAVLKAGDQMQGPLGITTLTSPSHGDLIRPTIDPEDPEYQPLIIGNPNHYTIIECSDLTIDISDGENFATVYTTENPPSAQDVGTLSQDQINTALSFKSDFHYVDQMVGTAVSKSGDAMDGVLTINAVGEGLVFGGWDRFAASYITSRPGGTGAWQLGKLFSGNENVIFQNNMTNTALTLTRDGIVSNSKDFYVGTDKVWHAGNLIPIDKNYVDAALESKVDLADFTGTINAPNILQGEHLDSIIKAGAYIQDGTQAFTFNGYPAGAEGAPGTLLVFSPMMGYVVQKWIPFLSGGLEYSRSAIGGTYTPWGKAFNSTNPPNLAALGGLGNTGEQILNGELLATKLFASNQNKTNQLSLESGIDSSNTLRFKVDNIQYDGILFTHSKIEAKQQFLAPSVVVSATGGNNGFLWGSKDSPSNLVHNTNWGMIQENDGSLVIAKYQYNYRDKIIMTIDSAGYVTRFEGPVHAGSFVSIFPQNQAANAMTRKDYVDQLIADLTARIAALEAKNP